MKSHSYDFRPHELLSILGPPLLVVGAFSAAMHLGALMKILPEPRPALDTDRTILLHQAEAARQRHDARIVLIGDSSCLMDVSTGQLSRSLPDEPASLNLGTLSYIDLHSFGTILRHYLDSNPGKPQAIVLLMHPEALRRPSAAEYHAETLARFYDAQDFRGPNSSSVLRAIGVEIFRGRLLSRAVPQPLAGAFGRRYGFTHDLWGFLSAHRGSAFDPNRYDPTAAQGNAEYRLAKRLELASHQFRSIVPDETRLIVGITPVPEGFVENFFP